jgi:hypothetical protein
MSRRRRRRRRRRKTLDPAAQEGKPVLQLP